MHKYSELAQAIVDKLGHEEAVERGLIRDVGSQFNATGAGYTWLQENLDAKELSALISE